jgi:hypothetical protein
VCSGEPGWLEIINGTHQLLVYADEMNILGGRIQTIEKKHKSFGSS